MALSFWQWFSEGAFSGVGRYLMMGNSDQFEGVSGWQSDGGAG
jgi:hypothetical protein